MLAERNPLRISAVEVILYNWIAAFPYDELGEIQNVGSSFYATGFWSLWDLGIIGVGFAYNDMSTAFCHATESFLKS